MQAFANAHHFVALYVVAAFMSAPPEQQTRAQPAVVHATSPDVSPDGRRIAFISNRDDSSRLYIMNNDGSGVRVVSATAGIVGRPYWLRDGRGIIGTMRTGDTTRVMLFSLDGKAPTMLGRVVGRGAGTPFPDASRFVSGVGPWAEMQLESVTLDGTRHTRLTADHAAYWCPRVSPSGEQIAVGRRDSTGMQIWTMASDGSRAHAVTHLARTDGAPQCPSWSADGRRLAVQVDSRVVGDTTKTTGHIWIVDLDTGRATQLAKHDTPYHDEVPVWFPDGRRIAFASDRTGSLEIWSMNIDGSNARQLTRSDSRSDGGITYSLTCRVAITRRRTESRGDTDLESHRTHA